MKGCICTYPNVLKPECKNCGYEDIEMLQYLNETKKEVKKDDNEN